MAARTYANTVTREQCVERCIKQNLTLEEAAQTLGLSYNRFRHWCVVKYDIPTPRRCCRCKEVRRGWRHEKPQYANQYDPVCSVCDPHENGRAKQIWGPRIKGVMADEKISPLQKKMTRVAWGSCEFLRSRFVTNFNRGG